MQSLRLLTHILIGSAAQTNRGPTIASQGYAYN